MTSNGKSEIPAHKVISIAPFQWNWERFAIEDRRWVAMRILTSDYWFSENAAAGIVGNLEAESAIIPSRLEGSKRATPMRAKGFDDVEVEWAPHEVARRSKAERFGPKKPGVGLAQWTSARRRAGLFTHPDARGEGSALVLYDMKTQLDYLATELRTKYLDLDRLLRTPGVSVNDAVDHFVHDFERPASVLYKDAGGALRRYPIDAPEILPTLEKRRGLAALALEAYRVKR